MSQLTTIKEKEIKSITSNFSTDTNLTYNPRTLRTVDDCVEQYRKADEVSKIAQMVIKDRMQGDALLKAKKLICGDDWNRQKLSNTISSKWTSFLDKINCKKPNASYLLDFAGYKEAEENLIEQGIEVTPISTASHYREAKKLSDISTPEAVATTYTQAVEANGGEVPKTAKAVVEAINTSKNKVSSEELFIDEYPEYQDIESPHNSFKRDDFISRKLPKPNKDEWKHFYKLVAKTIHPDKGGNEIDMAILTGFKEVYEYLHKQDANQDKVDDKMEAYAEWCKERGCEIFDWIEDN